MISRPLSIGAFEFAVLAALRATQLTRGCVPRVNGDHTVAVMAQLEVAAGAVTAMPRSQALAPVEEATRAAAEV